MVFGHYSASLQQLLPLNIVSAIAVEIYTQTQLDDRPLMVTNATNQIEIPTINARATNA